MTTRKGILFCVAAGLFALGTTGCQQMIHEFQMHRFWRMNQGPNGMPPEDYSLNDAASVSPTAYFASVRDEPVLPVESEAAVSARCPEHQKQNRGG